MIICEYLSHSFVLVRISLLSPSDVASKSPLISSPPAPRRPSLVQTAPVTKAHAIAPLPPQQATKRPGFLVFASDPAQMSRRSHLLRVFLLALGVLVFALVQDVVTSEDTLKKSYSGSSVGGGTSYLFHSIEYPTQTATISPSITSSPHPTPSFTPTPSPSPDAPSKARMESEHCGEVLIDKLVLGTNASITRRSSCTPSGVLTAARTGYRDEIDSPFRVAVDCGLRWMTAEEACDVLESANFLYLRGDSLTRHLAQSIFAILSGNITAGLNAGTYAKAVYTLIETSDADAVVCARPGYCGDAYNDGHWNGPYSTNYTQLNREYCRLHSAAHFYDVFTLDELRRRLPKFCPKWKKYHLCYGCDSSQIPQEKGFVYLAGGLHSTSFGPAAVEEHFITPLSSFPSTYRHICGLMHAPGINKQVKFLKNFGPAATIAYNEMVASRTCLAPGDALFDPYYVTIGATSFDGQHYLAEPNFILAQLLLATIEAMLNTPY
jgi:hypothetical protein